MRTTESLSNHSFPTPPASDDTSFRGTGPDVREERPGLARPGRMTDIVSFPAQAIIHHAGARRGSHPSDSQRLCPAFSPDKRGASDRRNPWSRRLPRRIGQGPSLLRGTGTDARVCLRCRSFDRFFAGRPVRHQPAYPIAARSRIVALRDAGATASAGTSGRFSRLLGAAAARAVGHAEFGEQPRRRPGHSAPNEGRRQLSRHDRRDTLANACETSTSPADRHERSTF